MKATAPCMPVLWISRSTRCPWLAFSCERWSKLVQFLCDDQLNFSKRKFRHPFSDEGMCLFMKSRLIWSPTWRHTIAVEAITGEAISTCAHHTPVDVQTVRVLVTIVHATGTAVTHCTAQNSTSFKMITSELHRDHTYWWCLSNFYFGHVDYVFCSTFMDFPRHKRKHMNAFPKQGRSAVGPSLGRSAASRKRSRSDREV